MCFFFNPFSTLLSSDRQILSFYIKVTMKGVDSLPFCELFSGSSVMPFFFILLLLSSFVIHWFSVDFFFCDCFQLTEWNRHDVVAAWALNLKKVFSFAESWPPRTHGAVRASPEAYILLDQMDLTYIYIIGSKFLLYLNLYILYFLLVISEMIFV